MAGAGYKLFNSGDVLTAAQVNEYLMQQTVMVFNDAAARTTALSGVLAEGMISYLKDTNATEVYNGSAWVGITGDGDITGVTAGTGISGGGTTGTVTITNDMATTITASGDIIVGTGSGTYDNLPIGTTGQVLTADTTVSPYKVKWAAAAGGDTFAAGKNKIINGDFYWNQRAFTSVTTTTYHFDRWVTQVSGGTVTTTPQTFTLGAAPVSGYEGKNYVQIQTASQTGTGDYAILNQRIESVRTFAGRTATVSFWAKATSGTPSIVAEMCQVFGTGGSPSAQVNTGSTKQAISTSWARYSFTFNVPSISGKTLGTNNDDMLSLFIWLSAGSTFNARTDTLGLQNNTFQIWGVQVEAGSTATDFQTATGTLAGELAACQRYYQRKQGADAYQIFSLGFSNQTTVAPQNFTAIVQMRTKPSSIDYGGTIQFIDSAGSTYTMTSLTLDAGFQSPTNFYVSGNGTGMTVGRFGFMRAANDATAYVGFNAEL